jgi:hypothetical protein
MGSSHSPEWSGPGALGLSADCGARLIRRLTGSGVVVLWLDPAGRALVMPGAIRVPLPHPGDAAAVIGQATAASATA